MNNSKAQPEFRPKEMSPYENHLVKQKLLEITDKLRQQRIGQQQPQPPSQLNTVMEQQQNMMHPYMTFQVHPHSHQNQKKDQQHFEQHAQLMQPAPSGPIGHQSVAHLQQQQLQQQQQQQQRMMCQMPLSPMQQKQLQNNQQQQQAYKSFSPSTPGNHGQNQNSFAQRPNTQQLAYKLSSPQQQQQQQHQQRPQQIPIVQPQQKCMYQLSPPTQTPQPQYQLFSNDQPSFTWNSLSSQQQQQKQKSQQSTWPPRSPSNTLQTQPQQQQKQQAQYFQANAAPQMIGYVIQTPVQQQASPQQQQKQQHHILANPGINGQQHQHQFHIAHQQQQQQQHQNACQSQVVGVNMTPIIATQANTTPMIAMSPQNQLLTCLPLSEVQLRTLAKLQQDAYNLTRTNSNNNGHQQQQQQQQRPFVLSPLGGTPKKQQTTRRSLVLVDVDAAQKKENENENNNEIFEKLDDACRDYFRMKELGNQTLDQIATIAKVANAVAAAAAAAGNQNQVRQGQDEKIPESNEVSDEEGTKSSSSISVSNDSGTSTGDVENDLFEKNSAVFEEEEEIFPNLKAPNSRGLGHDFLMNAYLAQERNRKARENGQSGPQSNNYYELFPKMPLTRPPPGFTSPRMK